MNIPAFTAESSLYRSRNSYRVATAESSASLPADSIVLALTAEERSKYERSVTRRMFRLVELNRSHPAEGVLLF